MFKCGDLVFCHSSFTIKFICEIKDKNYICLTHLVSSEAKQGYLKLTGPIRTPQYYTLIVNKRDIPIELKKALKNLMNVPQEHIKYLIEALGAFKK